MYVFHAFRVRTPPTDCTEPTSGERGSDLGVIGQLKDGALRFEAFLAADIVIRPRRIRYALILAKSDSQCCFFFWIPVSVFVPFRRTSAGLC